MRVSHIGAAPTGCMAEVGCMDSETLDIKNEIDSARIDRDTPELELPSTKVSFAYPWQC